MANSRASTTSGRRRAQSKAQPRTRAAAGPHKGPLKKAKKTSAKKTSAKPPVKGRGTKPKKASAKPKATPQASFSRALKIAFGVASVTLILAAVYLFWFRDSSFVSVEKVSVEGIEGPETEAVTTALTDAAKKMTTLNVDEAKLAASVSGFSTAIAIQADADFPHGLTIVVTDRPPVVMASDGGPPVAVAADGSLLPEVEVPEGSLPALDVESLPAEGKLTGEPLELAGIAGAAPDPLRPLIEDLRFGDEGIEVVLKGEIPVYFGDSGEAGAKWDAVSAVLANPQVKTLTHLDVRVPERPSIGGAAPPPKPEGEPAIP